VISSAANPRLQRARRLQGRRARDLSGLFVAEGEDLLDVALAAGVAPVEVLVAPGVDVGVPAVEVEPALLASVSVLGHPARVIAIFRRDALPAAPRASDLALELHGVRDPGNVGTLLRSLGALGPGVAVLGAGSADPTGPKAVRASMGAIFTVPLVAAAPPGLRVALDARADALLAELDLTGPVSFLVGGEREGLPADVAADVRVRIPLAPGADSLNAAMAGTIALYATRVARSTSSSAVGAQSSNSPRKPGGGE
jgi:RNA methyltransferase, TrmH family